MLKIDRDRAGNVRVTFVLRQHMPHGRVSVVGDFNEWRPGAHELRPRSNGTRSVSVTVPDGAQVRFRYLGEGGHWCNETEHPDVRQIGEDSVVVANPAARKAR
ncbi:MAG: isoamylase early set domain-containing protein [Actinophytocola sp.]|uniref:isoamylase early set domain-containing protein n=1 Tax=Actinophytocola sp. TaxID=1872138 RepID=UPI003C758AA8